MSHRWAPPNSHPFRPFSKRTFRNCEDWRHRRNLENEKNNIHNKRKRKERMYSQNDNVKLREQIWKQRWSIETHSRSAPQDSAPVVPGALANRSLYRSGRRNLSSVRRSFMIFPQTLSRINIDHHLTEQAATQNTKPARKNATTSQHDPPRNCRTMWTVAPATML
mmetsp:Transcript_22550/g.52024  ORF Transcript_22550/g.52024 Transcript_22550/m.52024 type:complete len:165 (-) Transcript_22550:7-501(-)